MRALVSAADPGKLFDLRCLVRERLITWLQRQPHGLPLLRAEATHQLPGEPTLLLGVPAGVATPRPVANVLAAKPQE